VSLPTPTIERLRRAMESIEEIAASWPRARQYAIPLLFLRFLSEWYESARAHYQRKYKGDLIRVERTMLRERFVVPERCTFARVFAERSPRDLGEKIDEAFRTLELSNASKLAGIFTSITFTATEPASPPEHNAQLIQLLEIVAAIDAGTNEVPATEWIGALAEFLISRFAEDAARRRLAYYTPHEIAELITRLVIPKSHERIYDPACGSGGLLIHTARAIPNGDFALYGHEPHHATWALCRTNLMFQNMDSARIADGDAISSPFRTHDNALQTFNIIISDPPFSLDWNAESARHDPLNRFKRGIPAKSSGDYALISHVVEALCPTTGRACLVVPLGTLFRGGSEKLIRGRLIEEGLLEGVVRLPSNLFFGTAIPAALLMFRTHRSEKSVFFIDASWEFGSDRNRNMLRDKDIEKIASTWNNRTERLGYSRLVSPGDIERNDFNLKVSLYIKTLDKETVDPEETASNIERLEHLLTQARGDLTAALSKLRK
jgi:type I restriction enzyme M protein